MRRTIGLLGIVVLGLALAPAAHATSGTMYISADTTLTEDHYGSIIVDADNITLDCDGHLVTGNGDWFVILVESRSGVTVKDCAITAGGNGLVLMDSTGHNTLSGNSSFANLSNGVFISNSNGAVVVDNQSNDNGETGFLVESSTDDVFTGNRATGNQWYGWYVFEADGLIMTGNEATANVLDGFETHASSGTTWSGNSASGSTDFGFLITEGSNASIFKRNTSSGNGWGFAFVDGSSHEVNRNVAHDNLRGGIGVWGTADTALRGNRIERNTTGLELLASSGNVITNNRIIDSGPEGWGVWIHESSNDNLFERNIARGNDYEGFAVSGSTGNAFIRNVSQGSNYQGISLYFGADDSLVQANVVTGNAGSGVLVFQSSHNRITGNRSILNNQKVIGNEGGISVIEGSSFNEILRNVGCNNGNADGYDDGTGADNVWEGNHFCTSEI